MNFNPASTVAFAIAQGWAQPAPPREKRHKELKFRETITPPDMQFYDPDEAAKIKTLVATHFRLSCANLESENGCLNELTSPY